MIWAKGLSLGWFPMRAAGTSIPVTVWALFFLVSPNLEGRTPNPVSHS